MRGSGPCMVAAIALLAGCADPPQSAEWRPAAAVARDGREISIMVTEEGCSSGDAASVLDRVQETDVRVLRDVIAIDVRISPRGGDQTCEGNPEVGPLRVELPEPIGRRGLVSAYRPRVHLEPVDRSARRRVDVLIRENPVRFPGSGSE